MSKKYIQKIYLYAYLTALIVFPMFATIYLTINYGKNWGIIYSILIIYPLLLFLNLIALRILENVIHFLRYILDKAYKAKIDIETQRERKEKEDKLFVQLVKTKCIALQEKLENKERHLKELKQYEKLLYKWVGSYYHAENSYSIGQMEEEIRRLNNISLDYSINYFNVHEKIDNITEDIDIIKDHLKTANYHIFNRLFSNQQKDSLSYILDNCPKYKLNLLTEMENERINLSTNLIKYK